MVYHSRCDEGVCTCLPMKLAALASFGEWNGLKKAQWTTRPFQRYVFAFIAAYSCFFLEVQSVDAVVNDVFVFHSHFRMMLQQPDVSNKSLRGLNIFDKMGKLDLQIRPYKEAS
jgi:hypothetical protein